MLACEEKGLLVLAMQFCKAKGKSEIAEFLKCLDAGGADMQRLIDSTASQILAMTDDEFESIDFSDAIYADSDGDLAL